MKKKNSRKKATTPKTIIGYHFTGDTLRDGRPIPPIGEWLVHEGKICPCVSGLHASVDPFDALHYARGGRLHRVELSENLTPHGDPVDKWVGQRRRIIASVDAEGLMRAFARWCAMSVVHLWKAPPVVVNYLTTGNDSLRADARDAAGDAAWADARDAARDAARAAARDAARDAAGDAAWAAARDAARDAARAAARDAARDAARAAAGAAARAAAGAAAGAAAWAAARDAARDAARAAAGDAAGDAARDAARAKQAAQFKGMVEAEFAKYEK